MNKSLAVAFILVTVAGNAMAQSYMTRAERFCEDSLNHRIYNSHISVNWINDGSRRFWYTTEGANGKTWWIGDTGSGRKSKLFDTMEMISLLNGFGLDKNEENFRLWEPEFNSSATEFAFDCDRRRFIYNIKKRTLKEIPPKEKRRPEYGQGDYRKRYSADSLFYATAVGDNLAIYPDTPPRNGSEQQDAIVLSTDGEHYKSFATGGNRPRKKDDIGATAGSPVGAWIGKSHSFLSVREDNRAVETLSIVDNLAQPRPKEKTYKFAMPGDKGVSHFDVFLADADSAGLYKLPVERFADQAFILPRFRNFQTSDTSAFLLRIARTRDTLDLLRIDARSHKVTTIISEVCRPHLNEQLFDYHVLNNGEDILWWSERDGKGRWYLYDNEGNLRNALTGGDFVSGSIVRIDTLGRSVVFEGYGREKGINPHYKFYYRAGFDGKKPETLLTPGNGEHSATFSPDGKMVFDSWSRMDMPPRHQICDMRGRRVMELESADISLLEAEGWRKPEVLELTAADSLTKLYGVVYLPSEIEEGKKYPIISNVYPGPQTDLVPQAFTPDDNGNGALAELGFIVINFSYRGSCPVRGREFYNFGYGNLRDYALDDDYAVIRQVAEKYPFADLERVGIYGHSGGGFMAAAAILTRPDFYKVAVSASGNHDNNIYTQWWGETFHGVKQTRDNEGNVNFVCRIPTNIELAGNLKGKLLLITGDVDDNVHPANTFRIANALIKNNKRFDLFVIPGADHGLGNKYYVNLIRYYFVENLLDLRQDDIDIVNHK